LSTRQARTEHRCLLDHAATTRLPGRNRSEHAAVFGVKWRPRRRLERVGLHAKDVLQRLVKPNGVIRTGLSTRFCDPSTSMAPRVFSAAMRLRLGATHHRLTSASHAQAATACSTHTTGRSTSSAARGCAASTRARGTFFCKLAQFTPAEAFFYAEAFFLKKFFSSKKKNTSFFAENPNTLHAPTHHQVND